VSWAIRAHQALRFFPDESVGYAYPDNYRTLFGVAPSKLKDDYAQWLLDEPSVNFAVSTNECCDAGISHLGIQVDDDAGLAGITAALAEAEQTIFEEKENLCCYARGNKTWASDPDGVVWETFHRLGQPELSSSRRWPGQGWLCSVGRHPHTRRRRSAGPNHCHRIRGPRRP